MPDDYDGPDGERPVETDRSLYVYMNKESTQELLAAGRMTLKMRKLARERNRLARERRKLIREATTRRPGRAKYPEAARMVGLAVSVVTREVGIAREEAEHPAQEISP